MGPICAGLRTSLLTLLACLAIASHSIADSTASLRVARARTALEMARGARTNDPSRSATLAAQAALQTYDAAVAERAAEIRSHDAAILKRNGPPPRAAVDHSASAGRNSDGERLAGQRPTVADLRALPPAISAPAVVLNPEVEPNDTPATATPLRFHAPAAVATGSVFPAGDLDYYSFVAPANSRVWVFADSGGAQQSGANSRDTLLTLYAPDGTTVLEFDNDDGTGNGGDGTIETGLSSAIAGAALAASGTYYVRVAGFHVADVINPYTLFVLVSYGATRPEEEPNDTAPNAVPLGLGQDTFGVRSASIGVAGDVDLYEVFDGRPGDTLFFAADADPDRNGGTDLVIDLLAGDASTVLLTVDSSINSVGAAEAASFVLPDFSSYFLRVRQSGGTGTGAYDIAAALLPQYGDCITTISSVLGSDSPDHPAYHGTFVNQLVRGGVAMQCAAANICPGVVTDAGLHTFDAYTFFQQSDDAGCVTVEVEAPACVGANHIFVAAYSESFHPDDLCAGYLGDIGTSPGAGGRFSFVTFPYQNYVVVVSEVNAGAGCSGYKLKVTGTCPSGLVVDAHPASGTSSNLNGVLEPEETVVLEPRWRGLSGGPLTGTVAFFVGPPGTVNTVPDGFADYGAPADGQVVDCLAAQDCYQVSVSGARPDTHWDASMLEAASQGPALVSWFVHVGGSFADVAPTDLFYPFIENIFHNSVTGGGTCGGFCPDAPALRKQMAVFVLKAKEGGGYFPPDATGIFADVPVSSPFARYIEELYHRGVVAGCVTNVADGSMNYCPDAPVLRQQMSVFLLKTLLGSGYVPPAAAGLFVDVPASSPFAPFIEDLFHRGIAAGCGASQFCPSNPNLRKQMAPFLVKTFGLTLYGH